MNRSFQPAADRAARFGAGMVSSRRRTRSRFVPVWMRLWAKVRAPQT